MSWLVGEGHAEALHGARLVAIVQLRAQDVGELLRQRGDVVVLAPLRVRADAARLLHQDLEVEFHRLAHARALHFDGDLGPVGERGAVDLPDAGRRDRLRVEGGESLVDRRLQLLLDALLHHVPRQGGDVVLQLRELLGQIRRDEVSARGEDLPELGERRAQALERPADPDGARLVALPPGRLARGGSAPGRPARAGISSRELVDAGLRRGGGLGGRVLLEPAALHQVEHALVPQHGGDLAVAGAALGRAAAGTAPL